MADVDTGGTMHASNNRAVSPSQGTGATGTVCATVITYNRRDMLLRCLDHLRQQHRPPWRIMVVDNASTDGTGEMLAQIADERVQFVSLEKNIGAAGGFNLGMRLAYRSGADFIWAMDDDVLPEPEALGALLDAHDALQARGVSPPFLVSTPRSATGALTDVPDVDRRPNRLGFPNWAEHLDLGIVAVRGTTFVSSLLPRRTLERFGVPIADMFIFGEDREYTVRVTEDAPGYVVGASRVLHARKLEGTLDIWRETDPTRLRYQHFLHRNTTAITLQSEPAGKIALHLGRQAKTTARLLLHGRWRRAWTIGWATAVGLVFRPAIAPVDADLPQGIAAQPDPAIVPGEAAKAA